MIDISVLTGERLTYISRAADMLVLSFGDDICRNYRGEWLSRYDLHCQCAWRITDGHGKIVLARVDIFFPPEGEEFTVDFDWDVRGNNAFDRKSVEILSGGEVTVTAARLVNGCDIKLELSNGLRFESFADSSIEEYWRLVVRDEEDSIQLVAEPTGISEV